MFGWRKKSAILFLAAAMTLGGALELQAVAPTNIITYQGRVLSANGVPVSDATLSMKFFFYTASSGGTCLWSNSSATCDSNVPGSTTARTVTLTSGLFTQNLGDTSDTFAAIADSTFADNASLYLEVIIGTETLTPRRLITAAPYALNSQTLDGLSSADFDLDRVYDNDSGSALAIDGASGLTFTSSVAANFTINLASTGDFVIQDNGTASFTVNDSGNTVVAGDLTISGDDLTMGTNTSGFLLVADGTNFNPVALSSDATISSTGALTIAANAVALSTDTTGNYVATVADSGNSTVTVSGSGSEGAAVTLNVIDVNCTDCLTTTEIADSYLLNSGDVSTGDLTLNDGTTDSPKLTFSPATGTSWELYAEDSGDDLQIVVNTASTETIDFVNGGAGVMDITIDGDLTLSGDDLTMGTNTSGFLLVADGTNFNPVALSSDATISSTGALTIVANAIALSTDTTGNYVATLADAGGSDFTISGSGSEGAAVTIDIAADAIDFDEMVDAMGLDAATSITGTAAETFTLTRTGTASAADVITEDGMSLNWTAGIGDSTTDFYHGLEIAVTSANHTAGSIVSALAITNLASADADGVENAVMIGSGWDRGICFDCDGTFTPTGVDGGLQWGSDANAVTLYRSANDTLRTGDNLTVDLDLTISGDDLFMGTNTSGFILVGDGTNYNPVDVSGDIDLSSAGAATIQANAVALSTDTTGNYVATLADAGGSDFTISGSGSEGAAVTIDIAADAIDFDEMVDAMGLDAATSITGTAAETFTLTRTGTASAADVITEDGMSLNWTAGVGDSTTDFYHGLEIAVTSANHTAASIVSALAISNLTSADADGIENAVMIGSGWDRGICFDCDGTYSPNAVDGGIQWGSDANAVTLYRSTADTLRTGDNFIVDLDLTISGDDLTMGTNTSGFLLVADGLNFNPVALSSDATLSSTGALTIAANAIALSTDTTGNYVATIADAGSGDFTVAGSGSEGAAVTLDVADDALDFAEFEDALDVDAATDINLGANLFSIDLDSTGDFAIRDVTTNVALFEDDSTIDITFPTAAFLTIDATTTANTTTTGVIDLNVSAGDAAVDALNIALVQNNGATGGTQATGLELTLEGNDADGDMFGIRVTSTATTNAAAGTYDALLVLTNNENTVGAVTDAIRITSGAGTAGSITTGLDFDTTDITTDIELQNAETISNDSDGKIAFGVGGTDELQLTATELAPAADGGLDLGVNATPFGDLYLSGGQLFANNAFDIDIDDNTASAFTISEGATNYLAFTTSNTGETATLGNSGLDSLTITTDNTAATDVGITGGLTVTSGATHNSFTVTSSADTETGALVTANSLTTGKGLSVTSSSTGLSSGTLLDIDYDASGTLSAKSTTFAEITNGRTNTATSGTLSDNYDLVKFVRSSTQNGVGGAFSSTGSVLYVENEAINTAGTLTDTANGIKVVMDADGTGHGMIITMGVVGSPAANGVSNQGLVIDVNETASADAVFLIRSDADGQADTEFRVDNDGDFQYDGTASTPASDLAEAYPSAQMLEPGDLVALDSVGGLKIAKTTQPFQGGLFGAISTKPAIRMGAETIGYDVALIGRILLKVSSEAGAIAVGDPLTASATVGHAMKATRAGMIVGYALEAFAGSGTGVINAFIDVGWYAGNVIGTDGRSTVVTDAVVVAPLGAASASAPTFDSFGLSLRGSAWNGNEAAAVEMMLQNVVSAPDDYRLSVRNTAESEVAYITNEGTMRIAGDMVIGGRLYPSDRGVPQTEKYIYYDGSAGPAGDFMRTNAKGWGTGSYDFAEMFPSVEKLIAGELVAFAPSGQAVRRATGVAGERVAGIVSTRPGFLAGENVEDSYPIALAGRVPTKVSAKNGDIVVGDPLTISDSPGVAMKATNAGQIVGYALESYTAADSDNLILAFVNVGYWSGGPQTVTIVQNVASQAPSGAQNVSALNMSGNIFLATNEILSIGRLEGMAASWSIERDGTIKTQALVKTVIESYQGTKVETIAVTSPEAVITLTGTAKLVEGKAEVRFEDVLPEFNDVISAIAPVRVIVTPSGPVSLYVSEKDQNHFVVQRFVGEADVEFDWMVTGYRKGFEPEEAEEASPADEVSDLFVPSVPLDLSAPDLLEPEAQIQEEPATPESPEETIVDPVTDDDGGAIAEEPSEVVDDQIIDPPEEPTAAE